MKNWLRLFESETFADHMIDSVTAHEAGFYYEEGGCWGMALALYDYFVSIGATPEIVVSGDPYWHAMVRVNGKLYDHSGETNFDGETEVVTTAGLIEKAKMAEVSPDDVEADRAAAKDIIEYAAELSSN